ncbi:MAG: ATP-binding cassette domain-containing protein, partial [Bacilli bacterium]|nr:ATP-binding cassette domain-containing protein [Bacilli bacterium]
MEIRLVDVSKYYYGDGSFAKGLESVNLSLKTDGSFCVITGESGAGKSTLIRILTGIEEFDEGEIYFDDKPLTGLSEKERQALYSANVSFVFQDYNLVESLSAIDNIVLALLKHGLTVKEAKEEAKAALKDVGLEKQAKKKASKLSGGERQRVAIARSLALKTKIIIFDEPTGNLDPSTAKEIIELINRLKDNRLIVYVTHDYPLVEEFATRHIVLSDNHVESDTVLKEGGTFGEPMIQEEPKMLAGSYFYIGQAFTFSRLSRLISTCLVLLSGALFAFGVASLATMAFVSTDITQNYVDMSHKTYISYPCGNLAQVKKEDTTAEEPYLADFAEGDFVRDNGGVLLYQDFYLFNDSSYTNLFTYLTSNQRSYRYASYLGRGATFRVGNLLPEGAEPTIQTGRSDDEIIDLGYMPASIVCYDSGSFITSSLGQSIAQGYMSPMDIGARLVI